MRRDIVQVMTPRWSCLVFLVCASCSAPDDRPAICAGTPANLEPFEPCENVAQCGDADSCALRFCSPHCETDQDCAVHGASPRGPAAGVGALCVIDGEKSSCYYFCTEKSDCPDLPNIDCDWDENEMIGTCKVPEDLCG